MSFLINVLVRSFLAQQAIDLVQHEVTTQIERELRARQESASQAASIRGGRPGVVDFVVLFSHHGEAVGLLDRFPDAALTRGNGNSFYAFPLGENRVVAAIPDDDRRASLELIADAVIDIFRPRRVISAGFAAGIAPGVALLSGYVPNVLIDAADHRTVDLRQMQLAAPQSAAEETAGESHANPSGGSFESQFRLGAIVTTRQPVFTAAQKRELRKNHAAQLADRSAFPVLNACRQRGVPVLPLRVVTSLYDEELPHDVKTHSTGTHPARRFGVLLGNFARRPGSVVDAIKQKQRHLEASDALARQIIRLLQFSAGK